jgi:transcriptional regulator with XRE-family HTH domain
MSERESSNIELVLTKDSLGSELRELREMRGLSQKSLAAQIGLVGAQVSQIESGKYVPSLDILNKILDVLDAELVIQLKEDHRDPRRPTRPRT